jgi:hypothetical protein
VTVCVEVEPADPSELGLMWQATPISPGVSVVEEIPVPPIEGQEMPERVTPWATRR